MRRDSGDLKRKSTARLFCMLYANGSFNKLGVLIVAHCLRALDFETPISMTMRHHELGPVYKSNALGE